MSAAGQLFETEGTDPRVERAAYALWERDAARSYLKGSIKTLWPRIRKHYIEAATVALNAADKA